MSPRSVHDLELVARASDIAEVVNGVTTLMGPSALLHVVDRELKYLVPLDTTTDSVRLDGEFRAAILASRSHVEDGRRWIALPERNEPVFVVSVEASDGDRSEVEPDVSALGALLGGHRHRFEDLERLRRRREMTVAAELQWDISPVRADSLGAFDVAGVLEPAYEVAGDLFDFASSDGFVWAYSFDGMGHGTDATISGALALAAVRNVRREGGTLVEQMRTANTVLFDQYAGDRFVTAAACRLDDDGSVHIVNAGHEPIRIWRSGVVERLGLDVDLPLGVQSDATYNVQSITPLSLGDGLVLVSDGSASQQVGGDGATFGGDRLDQALSDRWSTVPLQTGHDVVNDVLRLTDVGRPDDDITVVIVRRRDDGEEIR